MWDYLKAHERFVIGLLEGDAAVDCEQLWVFHDKQIRFMQHERLIHLIVTLVVAPMFLLVTGFATLHPSWPALALAALLLILTAAYIVHYFRLENGVQRWYHLANRIDERRGVLCARYEGDRA